MNDIYQQAIHKLDCESKNIQESNIKEQIAILKGLYYDYKRLRRKNGNLFLKKIVLNEVKDRRTPLSEYSLNELFDEIIKRPKYDDVEVGESKEFKEELSG